MREPSALSDQALLDEVDASARRERTELPHFLACLAEVERRGLHVDLGHHNLFEYCVVRLRLGEGAAMQRVCAARAAAKHPEVYARLRDGDLNLSGVSRLFPYLNYANAASVLARASGKRQREIEDLIAELASVQAKAEAAEREAAEAPLADEPDQNEFEFARPDSASPSEPISSSTISADSPVPTIEASAPGVRADHPPENDAPQGPRKIEESERATIVPVPSGAALIESQCPPVPLRSDILTSRRDLVRLDAPGVLKVVMWAKPDFREKLEIIRRLVGRTDGRLESILEIVFEAYRRGRVGGPQRSKSGRRTRRIAKDVKDFVWERDEGRCAYIAPDGVRCVAIKNLEFDHIRPWALGGSSDDPANIRLLCRAHNQHAARKIFGDRAPAARAAT